MNVIYDTGSDWLVVEGAQCATCDGDLFDAKTSGRKTSVGEVERRYGSVILRGNSWVDQVCLGEEVCRPEFEFYVREAQEGRFGLSGLKEPIDGVLGMAQGKPGPKDSHSIGPSFAKHLKK